MQIPNELITKFLSVNLDVNSYGYDTPYWAGSSNGLFSTHNACHYIKNYGSPSYNYAWIWKLDTFIKFKFSLWLCSKDRLPTLKYLHHIGIANDPICLICKKI